MNILDYNEHVEGLECHKVTDEGFGYSCLRKPAPVKPFPSMRDGETALKEGFNTHSMVLPSGCVISANEAGEVFIQEKDGQPKKIRNKDELQNLLVK